MRKRITGILMWMVLCAMLCAVCSCAAAEQPEITEGTVEINPQPRISDEQAEKEYLNGLFGLPVTPVDELPRMRGSTSGISRFEQGSAARGLYEALKAKAAQAAAGNVSSTIFTFESADFGGHEYTREDIGASSYQAVYDALYAEVGPYISPVINAVLYDCPYEMYWYDKTNASSTPISVQYNIDGEGRMHLSVTIPMCVNADYSATGDTGTTDLNTAKIRSVLTAVTTAQGIRDQYAGLGDYAKLTAYKDAICGLVDYNYPAAGGGTDYGDPWQLVWVFDGDDSTKVVCEGYSKAFQYLCDISWWNGSVSVISVDGIMWGNSSGNHMWNLVRMNGLNYLADVTNSDAGTTGQFGGLFMDGYDRTGTDSNGNTIYYYRTEGKVINDEEGYTEYLSDEVGYSYSAGMSTTFAADRLVLSETAADPDAPDPVWAPTVPESLTPGEDLVVTVPEKGGAEVYDISLQTGAGFSYSIVSEEPGTFVIPAMAFADGGTYTLYIYIGKKDYTILYEGYTDYTVAAYTGGQALTISTGNYQAGEPLTIGLGVADADQVLVQEVCYSTFGTDVYPYWTTIYEAANSGATVSVKLENQDNHQVRAAVKKNGVWSAWSNILFVGGNQYQTANATWVLDRIEVLPGEEFTVNVTYNGHTLDSITLAVSQGDRMATCKATGNQAGCTFSAGNSIEPVTIICTGYYTEGGQKVYITPETYDGPLTVKPGAAAPVPTITLTQGRAFTTDGTIWFRLTSDDPEAEGVYYEVSVVSDTANSDYAITGFSANGTEVPLPMTTIRDIGFNIDEGVSFWLKVRAYGPGYESETRISQKIYVTGTRDAQFEISPAYYYGGDSVKMAFNGGNSLTVYAPDGVNSIEVCKGDNNWIPYSIAESNVIEIAGYEQPMTEMPLVARYTNGNGEKRYSNVLFADYVRRLATPAVTAQTALEAGEPLEITVESVEDADYYTAEVINEYGWRQTYERAYRSGKITLAEYGLDAGNYTIQVYAGSWEGLLDSLPAEYPLTVTGTRPETPAMTEPDYPANPQYEEVYWVTLQAEGLEAAKAEYGTLYSAQRGTVMIPVTIWGYEYETAFRGLIGGRWSAAVRLTVPEGASQEEPQYEGDPEVTISPAAPKRGEDLRVNVNPVEGGTLYTVSLRWRTDEKDETMWYDKPFSIANGGLTIPGCDLMRAGTYDITISVYHGPNEEWMGETTVHVTVAENTDLPAAPTAELLTEDSEAYGTTRFKVTTGGGADRVYTYVHTQDWGENSNPIETVISPEATECIIGIPNHGSANKYNAWFCVRRDGVWSEAFGPVSFTIQRPKAWEGEGTISLDPEVPLVWDDFTINWTGIEDATWGEISVYLSDEGYIADGTIGTETNSYTVSGALVPHSGTVEIGITGYRIGYEPFRLDGISATVLDPTMEISAALRSADAEKGTVTLQLDNVTADRVRVMIDGKEAGLYGIGSNHGSSIRLTVPVASMDSRVQVANYGTDSRKWGTWSNEVTGRDQITYRWDAVLPADLKVIEENAFTGSGVTSVKIPDGCERIKAGAFTGAEELEMIYIPASVTEIGENAIPTGVTIVTPAGSPAETWAGTNYTVVHP